MSVKANETRVIDRFVTNGDGTGQIFMGTTIRASLNNAYLEIEYDYVVNSAEQIISDVFEHLSGNSSLPYGVSSIKIIGV